MNNQEILKANRIIFCHFDTYSTALVFARRGQTVLFPGPLPESASIGVPEGFASDLHDPQKVLEAFKGEFSVDLPGAEISSGFEAVAADQDGPIRIHLAQFMTQDAPKDAISPLEAHFKPISEMRGLPMNELNLMRQVFNLIMSG